MTSPLRTLLRTPLGQLCLALVAVVFIVCVFAVLGYRSTRQSVSDLAKTQRIALVISARGDCRSAISAPITEITRKTEIQAAKTTQLFNAALLAAQGGERATPEQVDEFFRENDKLTEDLARAAALPDDPNVIVEHGGTIDGKHFEACPKP